MPPLGFLQSDLVNMFWRFAQGEGRKGGGAGDEGNPSIINPKNLISKELNR